MYHPKVSTGKTFFNKHKGKIFVDKVNYYSKLQNSGNIINIFTGVSNADTWSSQTCGKAPMEAVSHLEQQKHIGGEDEQWASKVSSKPLNFPSPISIHSNNRPISSLPQEISGCSVTSSMQQASHLLHLCKNTAFPH